MTPEILRVEWRVQVNYRSGWRTSWTCDCLKEARKERRERSLYHFDGMKGVRIVRITEEEVA